MDNRLIFLYHLTYRLSDGGTQEDRVSALLDMRVQAVRLVSEENPISV